MECGLTSQVGGSDRVKPSRAVTARSQGDPGKAK